MLGFAIMMWFVSIVLILVSISLLRGRYSSMHGKVLENTNDKEGYAKASGKAVLFLGIGIAISGVAAFITNIVSVPIIILACAVLVSAVWFMNISKRFS